MARLAPDRSGDVDYRLRAGESGGDRVVGRQLKRGKVQAMNVLAGGEVTKKRKRAVGVGEASKPRGLVRVMVREESGGLSRAASSGGKDDVRGRRQCPK